MSTHPAPKDTFLTATILSPASLTYSINVALYSHLATHASDLALLLTSHREVYFSRFEYYTHRLTTFLQAITPHALSNSAQTSSSSSTSGNKPKSKGSGFTAGAQTVLPIPESFATNLILPLFKSALSSADESHFFCSTEFLDLITAVLELYIPQALNSKASLKPLSSVLECLLYIPDGMPGVGLLERLISSKAGGEVLKKLMASKSTVAKVFNAELLEFYICRVTLLVGSCLVSHGTSVEGALSDWVEIVILKSVLEDFQKQLEAHNLRPTRIAGDPKKALKKQMKGTKNNLPDLDKMRMLRPKSAADLKSQNLFAALEVEELPDEPAVALPPRGQVIEIPKPQLDERSFLTLRGLLGGNAKSPQSVPDVQEALKTLKTLITFQTLARILESFPCASCSKVCAGDVVRGKGFYDVEPGIKLPERTTAESSTAAPEIIHHIGGSREDKEKAKESKTRKSKRKGKEKGKKAEEIRQAEKPEEVKAPPPQLPEDHELPNILRAEAGSSEAKTYDPSSMFPHLPGPWRVILSTQAMKDLMNTQQDGTFPIVRRILEELATGYWNRRSLTRPHVVVVGTGGNSNALTSNVPGGHGEKQRCAKKESQEPEWTLEEWQGNRNERTALKLYKAIYGKNYRVLWGVEGAWDELEGGGWRQIIKIWRIGDHKEILESIPSVLKTHRGYSNNYIRGCKLRQSETGKGKSLRHLPARFALSEDTLKPEKPGATGTDAGGNKLSREEALGLHEALTTGKFYTLNEQMFASIQASKKSGVLPEFAFDVSEEETEIVRWWKSSVLILGRSGTGKTTCLVFKLLAGYLARTGTGLEPRQIFLTRSPILAGKIARYVRRLIDSQLGRFENPLLEVEQNDTEARVIRENADHDHDVDRNLFTIGKDDWPLVCTFDEFCGLLENTLKISDRADFAPVNTAEIQLSWEHRRVDFAKFKRAYWPSFPAPLRKGISVELVFAELMAVIKGGNHASDFLPLTKSSYLKLSSRLAPTFLEGSKERESVWRMYELYEDRRRSLGEWDDLDRCRDIRKGLSKDQELLERLQTVIGECYVDEVQDLRVGEVEILLRVVGNPRGVHLAGDTAQCISRDSTFRFQDVKALFFQLFGSMVIKDGLGSSKTVEESLEKPKLFLLAKNYRSHQGILALASSVVDLLWKVFPDVIDKLQPEIGHYSGPKPKLFIGFSSDMLSNKLFGAVDKVENIAEFGAEQVILVRDDQARNTLREEIGTINLILTIVESKGMEFDDVLLFNYFSGSPAGPSFRALVSMEEELKTKQGAGLVGFDRKKHAVLSAELRGLYVAITRPRARLWLIEENDENIMAMARLWSKGPDSGLVDIVLRGDKNAADMMKDMRQGKSNKPADWYRKGLEFLEKRLWHAALRCFESAGDSIGQSLSRAHILEQKAIDLSYGRHAESRALFRQAGTLFLESKHPKQASKCFITIKDWKSAAEVWSSSDHYRSAVLYEKARLFKEAAEQYHLCGNFGEAAATYSQGKYFVELLQYLIDHGHNMEPVKFRRFARLVNVLFRSQTDARKDLKLMAITLLGSDSEKETFLIQYDMTRELIQHYITTRQFMKAVRTCLSLGDYGQATQIIEFGFFENDFNADLVDEVFVWTETRRLQTSVSDFLGCQNLDILERGPSKLTAQKSFAREETKKNWRVLERSVMGQFRERRVPEDETKWNELGEDLQLTADLLIVSNGEYFGVKCDPREFPFQSFARCTEILKKANKDGHFPAAVVRFYSVSYIKDDPSHRAWVLPPSPLLPEGTGIMMSHDSAFEALNRQLSDDIAKSVYSLLGNAIKVFKSEALCEEFIVRGSCAFREEGICHYTHSLLTRDISLSRLELLNSLLETALCLTFPFQQRLFGDANYAIRYRGTVRTWLEQLLITTTFVSEFTTHPLINIGSLYSNPRDSERGVRNALEELLYHRITRLRVNEMSFSHLLQQVDLADALNIGETFGRKIISRIDWGRLDPIKTKPFGSFWDILRLRGALRGGDLDLVIELMWHIHPMQLDLGSQEAQYFHCVIGFWEQCCAFLIVISSSDEFLIKDNWRKIHLKYFSPCLVAFEALGIVEFRQVAEAAKAILVTITQHVLESLQKIQSCTYATLRMTWNKRPDILIRRVLDLLAICLCNMQQYTGNKMRSALDNPCLVGIIKEWNFWCRRKTVHAQESELDINKFMTVFADAFNSSYSGIETLALYQRASLRQPYSKFRFMQPTWKVKRGQFQAISSFNKQQKHPPEKTLTNHERAETGHTDSGVQAALTKAEVEAVSVIQSFWKKYWPLLLMRRDFEKTDAGMATKMIDGLCKTVGNTVDEVLPKKRLRRALLHELGVPALVKIVQVEHTLDDMLSETIVKMKAEDLNWTEREVLDEEYQSLCRVKDNLIELRGFVLSEEVIAGPVKELKYNLTEVGALAMNLSKAVGDITSGITGIEDQVAGRRAAASLKTAREQQLR